MGPIDSTPGDFTISFFTWINNHRLWTLGMGCTILLVAVAAAVWYFLLRSPGTPVGLQQAINAYRASERTQDSANRAADIPPTGVYRYRTTGDESLSFGGISRSFPGTTEMIVTGDHCATMRWEALAQHVEDLTECPGRHGGTSIASVGSFEQIAGTSTNYTFTCSPGTYFLPPHLVTGERWHGTCRSSSQDIDVTGQLVGATKTKVAGREVPAIHLHLAFDYVGAETGTNPNDYWIDPTNGLILRQKESVDLSQKAGPLGSVRYTETMGITVASESPLGNRAKAAA